MKKLIILAILILFPIQTFAMKVGVVTDIHAGSRKIRKSGHSIVYPKKAVQYFERAVKEMKQKGVTLIISLGDNTHDGKKKYYKQLKKIENKYGIKILWVHGNHGTSGDKLLGPATFVYEQDGQKFIILNTNICPKRQKNKGCLDQSQVDFLRENYTEGATILQHVPPLIENSCDFRTDFIAEENMRVWSGHFHKELDCGNTKVFPALTEHKHLTYRIVHL